VLLQQPDTELAGAPDGMDWKRLPLAEVAKRGWIDDLTLS
jgi:hypothetical protein